MAKKIGIIVVLVIFSGALFILELTARKTSNGNSAKLKQLKAAKQANPRINWVAIGAVVTAIGIVFATFLSARALSISSRTLNEMQLQRLMAYRPHIVLSPIHVGTAWGDFDYYDFIEHLDFFNVIGISMETLNIGTGTAKNIRISFDMEVLYEWIYIIQKHRPDSEYSLYISYNNRRYMVIDGQEMINSHMSQSSVSLSPNTNETLELFLPIDIPIILTRIFKYGLSNDFYNANLPIRILIEFEDIQGKSYQQEILLAIQPRWLASTTDGGFASYFLRIIN